MRGHTLNIILQALYILEDVVVDALQEIGLAALLCRFQAKRLVDNTYFDSLWQENGVI
jgi:hypothetical protein